MAKAVGIVRTLEKVARMVKIQASTCQEINEKTLFLFADADRLYYQGG